MTDKDFALSNLGKEVTFLYGGKHRIGIVVGYAEWDHIKFSSVIVSMLYESGWSGDVADKDDHILISSPLNMSFWYVGQTEISYRNRVGLKFKIQ